MYSDTTGLSYENPEFPDMRDDQQHDVIQPEPELRRAVNHPESPTPAEEPALPDVMADPADVPGPPAGGIDALLADAPLDDDPFDIDPLDDDQPIPATPRIFTPSDVRPRSARRITVVPPHPGEDPATGKSGSFRLISDGARQGGGDQPRRQRIRDLAMDARMRFWRERVAIMLVVGLLFGFLSTNWVVGLTLAILAGIAHAIVRSRSVAAVPPGVKLNRAQRITQRKLAGLERSGYRSLHARPIPDSTEFIDHLVVGPTGIYAIDSEKWNRKLPIRTRNGKQLWLGPASKKERLEHAKWEAHQAGQLLSAKLGKDITVRPALAIYGPQIPWDIAVIRDVDVFNGDRLRKYLKRRSKVRETAKLSREDVARIYEAAEAVLPWTVPAPDGRGPRETSSVG
jgi:Nuclease-related domain